MSKNQQEEGEATEEQTQPGKTASQNTHQSRQQSQTKDQNGQPQRSRANGGPIEKGTFNHFHGFLGRPGAGKSYGALRTVNEIAKAQPCYIFAHDTGWRLPEQFADGKSTGIIRHESIESVRHTIARNPVGVHCIPSTDAGDVIQIAVDTAQASLAAHGGDKGYPALVLIDEVVAAEICDPNYISDEMRKLLAMRRHLNVGVFWTCQSARMVHNQLLSLATRLSLYKITDKRDHDRLIQCGVPEEIVSQLASLPNYEHIDYAI